MKHIIFDQNEKNEYSNVLLIKENAFRRDDLKKHYIDPLKSSGISSDSIVALSLKYDEKGKAPVKLIKAHLEVVLKACVKLETKFIYVCDGNYFKTLTKERKVEPNYGYIKDCAIAGYEHIKIVLAPNYQAMFANDTVQAKIDMSLSTLVEANQGTHKLLGSDIIHYEYYPEKVESIKQLLDSLHKYPELVCDVETFSLKHYDAGIGTIGFAWDQHNGVAFPVDYKAYDEPTDIEVWDEKDKEFKTRTAYGYEETNHEIRALLKEFFENYKGNLKFHNASFDATVLIYQLWMETIIDQKGMYTGLDIMTRDYDCTQIITYLATNTCAGNKLGLKAQSHEFAGAYGQDNINDIRLIPKQELLTYNLTDCLATWFTYYKNYPIMVQDDQLDLYLGEFKKSMTNIIQMQLTGMPMCMKEILKADKKLQGINDSHLKAILADPITEILTEKLKMKKLVKDFKDRKEKAVNPEKLKPKLIEDIKLIFNPGSHTQVAVLLHDVMDLPVIETTKGGAPSTDEDTLTALVNHTSNQRYKDLIEHILGLNKVSKILNTFMPAFKEAQLGPDGIYYLFGSFKLGGTISGRLSCSNPNLQTIPSGSTYAKIIKACFKGNKEWIYCGADFASLEDYVNALITDDPNKLKIYLEGYDSHSLRAKAYWPEKFPMITNTVESVNSIKKLFGSIRSDSKPVTFALTFQGTFHTLMKNCGFPKKEAMAIENTWKEMYKVSMDWVSEKLRQSSKDGYVTLAFGLRLRTPILKKIIWQGARMPYEASAEGRSAGNAVSGQSYGLLNNRAANEFMDRVRNSEYKYDIKQSALIHDAIYLMVRNDVDVIKWVNDNLVECMEWQELPELKHDKVKLNAELDLFYPSWANGITLPNRISVKEIRTICVEAMKEAA